jgi:3-deoxy-D-manno-octulosonic-acid transferase
VLVNWLFNLGWMLVLALATPWLAYRRWVQQKRFGNWGEKLLGLVPVRSGSAPCIWLHAVSVGEVVQLSSLIAELERQVPGLEVVISTTTTTGNAVARQRFPNHTVIFWPLDFTWAISTALRRLRPNLVVLVELELWPNFLSLARHHHVPVALINGRITERSLKGYRRLGPLVRRMLSQLDWLSVQNREYADRFLELGVPPERLSITGSIKFDGVLTDPAAPAVTHLRQLLGIPPKAQIFLAGSTHAPEEQLALAAWQQVRADFPELYLLLAPRHAERFEEVATLVRSQLGLPLLRRSELKGPGMPATPGTVILLDSLGELSRFWGLATVAFVGGSLTNRGGQSMIEPAGFGVPLIFGPQTWNFATVVAQLQAVQGATVVRNGDELTESLRFLMQNPALAQAQGRRAQELIISSQGATRSIAERLAHIFTPVHSTEPETPQHRERQAA